MLPNVTLLYIRSGVVPLTDKLAHLGLVLVCESLRSRIIVAEVGNEWVYFTVRDFVTQANKGHLNLAVKIVSSLKQCVDGKSMRGGHLQI